MWLEKIVRNMNDNSGSVRIDIWLWAVRLFKTRSLAGASCRGSKVRVNGEIVKPSKMLRVGDMLDIQKDKSQITVEVLNVLKKRVSAKEAINFKREISIITAVSYTHLSCRRRG